MTLVTGGTGFIGSHLLEELLSMRVPVRGLIRSKAGVRRLPAGVEEAPGDLSTGEGLHEALDGVDTVIHLAGATKALVPADYYTGNVRATEKLLGAISGRAVRLVHVSSLAAIGPSGPSEPVNEDSEARPVSQYGKSKWQAEQAVRLLAPDAVIVRPPVVYGPRDTDVFQLLKSISKGLVLEISGGERWFSAIYVRDLVRGILAAARDVRASGRVYFLAHSQPASWSELGRIAARIMKRSPRVVRIPLPAARAVGFCAEVWSRLTRRPGIVSRDKIAEAQYAWWTCDPRRAAVELGFEARTPLAEGLALTLAWYKEEGWLHY